METVNNHVVILESVISGLKNESNDVHRMASAMPIGPTEQKALSTIANNLRFFAERLENIRRELSEGKR